ncbi:MAG TPA: carboxylesterase/lipase family protein [Sphingobium sp.]
MSDLEVATVAGVVKGDRTDGVRRWRGIPYAQAARFQPPSPVAPWDGVRDATRYGNRCPQQMGKKVREDQVMAQGVGEDCLMLNIWTPDGGEPGLKPVFFWIHGGAFMAGSSDAYRGAELAKSGDIVVVTINYRVGVFGFVNFGGALGLPGLPSNIGLRDQIAALQWVRDNIAAFGGDPARVTIAGQSAGSMSVSLLMLTEAARGLFHGAIMQSGAVSLIHDRESSLRVAGRYAEVLGLDQGARERLLALTPAELLNAQAIIGGEEKGGIPAAPFYDGDLLPASLEEAHLRPTPDVPLIAGATRDEIRLFELMPGEILPTSWAQLDALVQEQLPPEQAKALLAAYPRTTKGRRRLATDLTFAMPTRNFAHRHAQHSPTWYYRFDYAHPIAGATHGLDLAFTWPFDSFIMTLVRGGRMAGRRAALAERIRGHIAHFTRHGTPGEDWPAYTPTQRNVHVYDLADRLEVDPQAECFAAWGGRDVSTSRRREVVG